MQAILKKTPKSEIREMKKNFLLLYIYFFNKCWVSCTYCHLRWNKSYSGGVIHHTPLIIFFSWVIIVDLIFNTSQLLLENSVSIIIAFYFKNANMNPLFMKRYAVSCFFITFSCLLSRTNSVFVFNFWF